MEKHPNPFDEFLKETLKGHQLAPPEEAKKAFLREASTIIRARKGWLKWYYIPVLVILISGTIAILYFREENVTGISNQVNTENIQYGSNTEPSLNSNSRPVSVTGKEAGAVEQSTPAVPKISPNVHPASKTEKLPANNNPVITRPEIPDTRELTSPGTGTQQINLSSETTSSILALDSTTAPAGRKADTGYQSKTTLADSASSIPSGVMPEPQKPVAAEPVRYFTAGAFYLPEWMFNMIEGDKFVNNFGFEATFYRGFISIRTGAGISISKGITENAVKYNDYLGTFNKLDSVTFVFDESSHNFLPSFYMSKEKIWDSISKLDSTNIVKRYTYLQIPLVLGFDFWQRGRFTIGVRIGTIMSVLLNSKQISGEYNPGENMVIGIYKITPDRVSLNWQAIGGLNASARLTKSIFFELEPQAKYYYQSIYEKSGFTKKPWSIGIRTAVLYKF
jgi:hypothetical protein